MESAAEGRDGRDLPARVGGDRMEWHTALALVLSGTRGSGSVRTKNGGKGKTMATHRGKEALLQ